MTQSPEILSWAGSIITDIGALILCLNVRYSNWGFVIFLVGNLFWIKVGVETQNLALATNQIFLLITSAIGIWRWMLSKHQQG